MNDIIVFFGKAIIVLTLFLIIIALLYNYNKNYYGYEYITMKDEFGIASKCYITDKGLFCKDNNNIIEVKQYRKR